MTKRKRDIFTVIESINTWFKASEPATNAPEGLGKEASNPRISGTSSDPTTNPSVTADLTEYTSNEGL